MVTPAYVVRTVDYGETDRVVTLLALGAGKVGAMARGARRSRRRFGAALSPFVLGEALLRARRGDLLSLDAFDALRDHAAIATDPARAAHGAYLTEIARDLSPEHHAEPEVFHLYDEALALLDRDGARVELLRAFELRLLAAIGIVPRLDGCAACGADDARAGFSPARGGALCGACAGPGDALLPLSDAARADLRARAHGELLAAAARPIDREVNAQARDALVACIEAHLGRRLRSPRVIAQLARPR